ncbi:MAG: hypothetical protein KatS3mg032_0426 [Cyclobacteriaceae bacterium]|nr:MAG: hypothetical protein KatS3mg032_0426 [Cyclobacteriaceae bacterium]
MPVMIRLALLLVGLLSAGILPAQHIVLKNGFLADSVKTGSPVHFFLVARYPENYNILFPDSAFLFTPFEFRKKQYFPTRTTGNISCDSAVYELVTFEINDSLWLALPVFHISGGDTIVHMASPDTVFLQHTVKELPPDTIPLNKLPLKTNTTQQVLTKKFNYLIAALLLLAGAVLITILTWLFGPSLRRYLRKRKLIQNHNRFMNEFNARLEVLRTSFNVPGAEAAVALWKKHAEQLTGKPFTRLTSHEILVQMQDEAIYAALKEIDRSIYGYGSPAISSLEYLKNKADDFFAEKLREVSHG